MPLKPRLLRYENPPEQADSDDPLEILLAIEALTHLTEEEPMSRKPKNPDLESPVLTSIGVEPEITLENLEDHIDTRTPEQMRVTELEEQREAVSNKITAAKAKVSEIARNTRLAKEIVDKLQAKAKIINTTAVQEQLASAADVLVEEEASLREAESVVSDLQQSHRMIQTELNRLTIESRSEVMKFELPDVDAILKCRLVSDMYGGVQYQLAYLARIYAAMLGQMHSRTDQAGNDAGGSRNATNGEFDDDLIIRIERIREDLDELGALKSALAREFKVHIVDVPEDAPYRPTLARRTDSEVARQVADSSEKKYQRIRAEREMAGNAAKGFVADELAHLGALL